MLVAGSLAASVVVLHSFARRWFSSTREQYSPYSQFCSQFTSGAWAQLLEDEKQQVRRAAVAGLHTFAVSSRTAPEVSRAATRLLLTALGDSVPAVRSGALAALAAIVRCNYGGLGGGALPHTGTKGDAAVHAAVHAGQCALSLEEVGDMGTSLCDSMWEVRSGVLRVWGSLPTLTAASLVAMVQALRSHVRPGAWSRSQLTWARQMTLTLGREHPAVVRAALPDLFQLASPLQLAHQMHHGDAGVTVLCGAVMADATLLLAAPPCVLEVLRTPVPPNLVVAPLPRHPLASPCSPLCPSSVDALSTPPASPLSLHLAGCVAQLLAHIRAVRTHFQVGVVGLGPVGGGGDPADARTVFVARLGSSTLQRHLVRALRQCRCVLLGRRWSVGAGVEVDPAPIALASQVLWYVWLLTIVSKLYKTPGVSGGTPVLAAPDNGAWAATPGVAHTVVVSCGGPGSPHLAPPSWPECVPHPVRWDSVYASWAGGCLADVASVLMAMVAGFNPGHVLVPGVPVGGDKPASVSSGSPAGACPPARYLSLRVGPVTDSPLGAHGDAWEEAAAPASSRGPAPAPSVVTCGRDARASVRVVWRRLAVHSSDSGAALTQVEDGPVGVGGLGAAACREPAPVLVLMLRAGDDPGIPPFFCPLPPSAASSSPLGSLVVDLPAHLAARPSAATPVVLPAPASAHGGGARGPGAAAPLPHAGALSGPAWHGGGPSDGRPRCVVSLCVAARDVVLPRGAGAGRLLGPGLESPDAPAPLAVVVYHVEGSQTVVCDPVGVLPQDRQDAAVADAALQGAPFFIEVSDPQVVVVDFV